MMKTSLNILVLVVTSMANAGPDEKEFSPPVAAEQAAITARRVLAKHNFNPKSFEIRSIQWKREIIPRSIREGQSEAGIVESHNQQLRALQEQFGNGPAWEVQFWRTKQVEDNGAWYDGIQFGLTVLVFDPNRAAVIDSRTSKPPSDTIVTE